MRWRRRSDASDLDVTGDEATATMPSDGAHPDVGHPDVVILDELSRVFGDTGPSDTGPSDTGPSVDAGPSGGIEPSGDTGSSSPPPSIITIGADDDLPDAVYLDEESPDASVSAPVFIDDDGSSDAIMPKEATDRGIEPRLRQRRIGVRRAASRKRLWWAAIVGIVVIVLIGVLAVLGSSLFAVSTVSVTGNVYTNREQLAAVVDELKGTPVLLVDNAKFEKELEDIAWVEDARVTTSFPNSASIEIRERTPVASMLGEDTRSRVLDAHGRVLDVIDGQPVALVWISGEGTLDLAPGDTAPIGIQAASSLVTKLTPTIRGRLESIVVKPDGSDLKLVLTSPTGPIEVRFGSAIGDSAQIEKLVRLERKLADVGEDPVTVIDVSTSEVTVR
jgi:cell division protein FtsQ